LPTVTVAAMASKVYLKMANSVINFNDYIDSKEELPFH
jgi:hypothetical protein